MKENCSDVSELDDNQWLLDLCFLADITKKLNELNLKLQEGEKLITDCYEDIQAFVTNQSKNEVHFPLLNSFKCDSKDVSKHADQITQLLKAFHLTNLTICSTFLFAHLTLRWNRRLRFCYLS